MTQKLPEVDLDTVPMMEEPEDDLAEYTFPKFAVTYFQKSASHTHTSGGPSDTLCSTTRMTLTARCLVPCFLVAQASR